MRSIAVLLKMMVSGDCNHKIEAVVIIRKIAEISRGQIYGEIELGGILPASRSISSEKSMP